MDYAGEDSDVSESEMEEYVDKSYQELKSGSHIIKISEEGYTCPYCPKKRKRDFLYKELIQHAGGVGKCNSQKQSAKDKANHLALEKYLEKDLVAVAAPSVISVEGKHKEVIHEEDEKLKGLKKAFGDEVYNAVTSALT